MDHFEDTPDVNPWTISVPDCVVCDDKGCSHCPNVDKCRRVPLFDKAGNLTSTAIVSDEDFEMVGKFSWYRTSTGYAATSKSGYMHRMIMGLARGDGLEVDHKNHDTLDNRRENLRVVTHAENHTNRKLHAKSTSGLPGVVKKRNKWAAQTAIGGKTKYLGTFSTPRAARRAVLDYQARNCLTAEPFPQEYFDLLDTVDLQRLILDARAELYRRGRNV